MFCPECGALLRPKGGVKTCARCGYQDDGSDGTETERVVVRSASREKEMTVIEESGVGLPEAEEPCPECGHIGAYYYERQTRAADEATTRFYICSDCDHRWRDYQ